MKKFALVALVLASSTSFAQTFGDLNYFQKQGSFLYKGSFSSTTSTTVQKSSNIKFEEESIPFKNQLSFGVLDNLNVFAEVSYKFGRNLRQNNNIISEDNGFTNPALGANYRLINSDLFVDLFAKVNGRIMDSEKGVSKKDGNSADAADFKGEVGVAVGKKISDLHEVRFALSAAHSMEGEYTTLSSPETKTDTDSVTDFAFAANYQYRPVETFMFDFGYNATFFGETSEKTGASKSTRESHLDHMLSAKAKAQVNDSLVVSLFVTESIYLPDYDGKTNGGKDEIKRRKYSDFGIGLDLLF